MARPTKIGLDYYPMDTDFFERDDVNLLVGEFGWNGAIVLLALLNKIYKNGYYYQWGEDVCLLFCKKMGAGLVPNFVNEVINGCIRRSFFDKGVFDSFNILTSREIQETYLEAKSKSKYADINQQICLIDYEKSNQSELIPKKQELFPKKQELIPNLVHKEKKRKEKEIKGGEKNVTPTPIFSSFDDFSLRVNSIDMVGLTPEIRRNFIAYHSERTDWQRMTEDSLVVRLMKWINTEFPKKTTTNGEKVLSYEQYYNRFRTTEPIQGWERRYVRDDEGNIINTEFVHL